ncbi:hypothetical protein [Microbacterium sp. Leaf436]|uniref:hypothetical protein n=1 Tax=Microbacterium sp. Leaf436 TaxID=1736377 RepID=UPI0006F3489E|nr:hypothetical protein [Microbacterium sp. Leaf436]KQT74139.1 hypothetical protein ASG45_05945 [Microbacterium sp. Leaf436]
MRLDDFLLTQFELDVATTVQIVSDQARAMGRPPVTEGQLLRRLARSGAPRSAEVVGAAMAASQAADEDAQGSGAQRPKPRVLRTTTPRIARPHGIP